MNEWTGKTYWLIGASEGLGRALSHQLSRVGCKVVLSARSEDRLNELAGELPGEAQVVPMDVTDADSVAQAAQAVGDVDGMVYLAGVYWPMDAKQVDAEKLATMGEINFIGALRCVGQVLPRMIARDHGHLVLTGSLSGFRGLPGAVGYGASKAGVMSLAETLHADTRRTGVRVQLVNPGFIKTRLTDKNDFKMPFLMTPDEAAREIFEHMNGRSFARNFPTLFSWLFRLSRFLPDSLYYRIVG